MVLTNTLNVPVAMDALIQYTLQRRGMKKYNPVNAVVGETNDSWLNDIRKQSVNKDDVLQSLAACPNSPVSEGCVGAEAQVLSVLVSKGASAHRPANCQNNSAVIR